MFGSAQTSVAARLLVVLFTPLVYLVAEWTLARLFPLLWLVVRALGALLAVVMWSGARFVYRTALFAACAYYLYLSFHALLSAYPMPLDWMNEWLAHVLVNVLWSAVDHAVDTVRNATLAWLPSMNATNVTRLFL